MSTSGRARLAASSLAALRLTDFPSWKNEGAFQSDVIRLARDLGWGVTIAQAKAQAEEARGYGIPPLPLDGLIFHPRYSLGSEPGWPDLFLARRRDGRVLLRELKQNDGKPSHRQAEVLDLLAACGLDVGIWRPKDWTRIQEELR